MKFAGIALIIFALVDFIGSYSGFDLWGSMGISLPDIIWQYSAFIEGGIGYFLLQMANTSAEPQPEVE